MSGLNRFARLFVSSCSALGLFLGAGCNMDGWDVQSTRVAPPQGKASSPKTAPPFPIPVPHPFPHPFPPTDKAMTLMDTIAPQRMAPRALLVEDMDGDGFKDIVVAGFYENAIDVLYGKGNGDFEDPVRVPTAVSGLGEGGPSRVAAVDFNKDGKLDLVFDTFNHKEVQVWLNKKEAANKYRTFSQSILPMPGRPMALAHADWNGDGKQDFAVYVDNFPSNPAIFSLFVYMGKGDGTFVVPRAAIPLDPAKVLYLKNLVAVDINEDGAQDIVATSVAPDYSSSFVVLPGNGTGGFGAPRSQALCYSNHLIMKDFNGDGRLDVLAKAQGPLKDGMCMLFQQRDGRFVADASWVLPRDAFYNVGIVDLNGDAKLDLVGVIDPSSAEKGDNLQPNLVVYAMDGRHAPAPSQTVPASRNPSWFPGGLVTADLNRDGKLDVVVANEDAGTISIFLAGTTGAMKKIPDRSSAPLRPTQVFSGRDHTVVLDRQASAVLFHGIGRGFESDGTFFDGNRYFREALRGSELVSMAMGDLNGDGHDEVLVLDRGVGKMKLLKNVALSGDTRRRWLEESATTWPIGSDPSAVVVFDWDRDGKMDVLVAEKSTASFTFYKGNGDFSLGSTLSYPVGTQPAALFVFDFNRDGVPDVAVLSATDGNVRILLQDRLQDKIGMVVTRSIPIVGALTSMDVADVNGDGVPDVVVTDDKNGTVWVIESAENANFSAPRSLAKLLGPRSIQLADFTGDGVVDMAIADTDRVHLVLFKGDGNGNFVKKQEIYIGEAPAFLSKAFLNNDKILDLLVINAKSGTLSSIVTTSAP